jgi:LytS/YehU family sensor histidine kinase
MAAVAEQKGDFKSAIGYLLESLEYYQEIGAAPSILSAYPFLARLYAASGNYQKAYETQKEFTQLADSFAQAHLDSKMAEQLAAFEANRLKQDNDSIQAALTISEQAGVIKDLQLSRYSYLVTGLAGMLVLMVILVLVIVRSNQLKQELRIAELKHTVLRARMNPHFLFNALNSIQNAILNRDKMVAYEYHAKFSELMRMILMHSDKKTIKLKEEVQAIKLYLDLEQFRTGHGFSYRIETDKEIDENVQEIPSMLLQPFVENAIWHGVLNRESPGNIDIRIGRDAEHLNCAIEDDGVGREASYKLRDVRNPGHESVATQLTRDRLELFRKQYGKSIGLKITDKKNGSFATGTLVELSIQLSNKS